MAVVKRASEYSKRFASRLVSQYTEANKTYRITTQNSAQLRDTLQNISYRICGLVVRVPGDRHRGPKFDTWLYHIFCEVVGLER
jgi:hypothetical protein